MSKEQTQRPERDWSSVLSGLRRLGDRRIDEEETSDRLLAHLRRWAVIVCYGSLLASGLLAVGVSTQASELATGPVALGWSMLTCWFGFYSWAQHRGKRWTAAVSLVFALGTSAALAFFCLQYLPPADIELGPQAPYVSRAFEPYLELGGWTLLSFTSSTVFHFISSFFVGDGG